MAISGPHGSHHHDDDSGEAPPSFFSDINITPLTDIFLVLLIIFMVTSTALVEAGQGGAGAGVRVDLPKGAAKELHVAAQDFPVAILADGQTVVEGKVVDAQTLRQRLEKMHKDSPDAQLIIQADTGTHHGKVVEVMEIAKSVGLDKLAIATESEGK
jgi:biopolymer transport protein ExbD